MKTTTEPCMIRLHPAAAPRQRARWHRSGMLVPWLALPWALPAQAWEMAGQKLVWLHGRDGQALQIGTVDFTPRADGRVARVLKMDHGRLKDHFLSMRESECVDGQGEVFCQVPYPHPNPATLCGADLAWLEHALLFMFKLPCEFCAKLWHGVHSQLRATPKGPEGRPQAVDPNLIGAPLQRADVPPFRPALRDDIRPEVRWFNRPSIE